MSSIALAEERSPLGRTLFRLADSALTDAVTGRVPRIAVLVPCYNEEVAVAQVIHDFRNALPNAVIYVYDNNSQDRTVEQARAAGAIVRSETLQGKGNVVRRMFADVEADVYVMVDGDNTYDAAAAPELISVLLSQHLDMVNGRRITDATDAYRAGHRFGNKLLFVNMIFGNRCRDVLSGYRVLSHRFVKSFPALSEGFEIETEITVHALELRMPLAEVDTAYKARLDGSVSKLRTYRDGLRICRNIFYLVKEERPLPFFGTVFLVLAVLASLISIPIFTTYFETGLVPRFPTIILATGMMLVGFSSLVCGLVLDTVTLGRREAKRMRYLAYPAPGSADD